MYWTRCSLFAFLITLAASGRAIGEDLKSTDQVAAAMTSAHARLRSSDMVPNGAALITSSGALSEKGIKHIIHAAPGAMTVIGKDAYFEPTLDTVKHSIANSLTLARQAKAKRVAIPLVGGGVWLERMKTSKEKLSEAIVESALQHRGEIAIVLVGFTADEAQLFRTAIARSRTADSGALSVAQGSLTDHAVHHADAIVNAANMEMEFGGGLSGAIGKASGKRDAINAEAKVAIQEFWRAQD